MAPVARDINTSVDIGISEVSPGFVQGTLAHGGPVALDPFLALTEFHMSRPTFAPHPHAGFSAVTYMFRDSAGSFRNRDSLGDSSLIGPGDLHWTQAASGMMHEEIPTEPGVDCHGLQLFVNLASDRKHAPPRAFHVDAGDVPVVEPAPGATVRVVTGEALGVRSPLVGLATPVVLLDVELQAGAEVPIPVADVDRAVVMIVHGRVAVAGRSLGAATVASLDGPGDHVMLVGGAQGATLLVLMGEPIDESIVFGGPFCMNTHDELLDAQRRFRAGDMGSLAPSF